MMIGNCDLTHRLTAARNDCGQSPRGPSDVAAQSWLRMRSPSSPPPLRKSVSRISEAPRFAKPLPEKFAACRPPSSECNRIAAFQRLEHVIGATAKNDELDCQVSFLANQEILKAQ